MAINAIDLDCIAHLAIELSVAVIVLLEVTINTVHALFQMNVFQVDRQALVSCVLGRAFNRALQFVRVDLGH